MSTITSLAGGDAITTADSMTKINTNFTNLNTDKIETSVIDTDTALTANSDAKIPSQKAVKAYVDSGGNVNASTTTKGIVEIATQAEVNAGTQVGETGATLVVSPELIKGAQVPIVRTYLNAASPATWSKPTGLRYVVVEVQAAGGDGGAATNNSGAWGGGGGGGGYSKKLITVGSLGSSETVTIGAVGANSSFGAHATANFGVSGTNDSPSSVAAGGTASGGDINIPGQASFPISGSSQWSGGGGSAVLGLGAAPQTANNTVGIAGTGYGSGASGGTASTSTNFAGGTGGPAIVIVTEYY
jgi:hypothetical protein